MINIYHEFAESQRALKKALEEIEGLREQDEVHWKTRRHLVAKVERLQRENESLLSDFDTNAVTVLRERVERLRGLLEAALEKPMRDAVEMERLRARAEKAEAEAEEDRKNLVHYREEVERLRAEVDKHANNDCIRELEDEVMEANERANENGRKLFEAKREVERQSVAKAVREAEVERLQQSVNTQRTLRERAEAENERLRDIATHLDCEYDYAEVEKLRADLKASYASETQLAQEVDQLRAEVDKHANNDCIRELEDEVMEANERANENGRKLFEAKREVERQSVAKAVREAEVERLLGLLEQAGLATDGPDPGPPVHTDEEMGVGPLRKDAADPSNYGPIERRNFNP